MASNTELLVELGVDSSKFSKQITAVTKEVKELDKELKALDTTTDDYNTNMKNMATYTEKCQTKINNLETILDSQNKALTEAKTKFENAKKAQEEYLNGTEKSAKETEKHQKAVEQAGAEVQKYTNGIKETERQIQSATQDLAKMNAEIAKAPFEEASKKMSNWSNGLSKVSNATKPLTLAIGGIATASVAAALSFDDQMTQVQAVSGATADEIEKLKEVAREMGETTEFSATQAGEALYYMSLAGWDTEQSIAGLPAVLDLATAAGMDLGNASDIVTDALTAFGLKAEDATSFCDVLAVASSNSNTTVEMLGSAFKNVAPLAGAMGYSINDVSLALGLMANAGIKSEAAGTQLKTLLANMTDPTEEMATAMGKYNISLTDSEGNMKSLSEVIGDLRNVFASLDETQQAELASTLAGKEGMAGLLAIVNAGEADYNKLTEAINGSEGACANMAETMRGSAANSIESLKSKISETAISIGEKLLPHVLTLVEKLESLVDWFNNLSDGTQDTIINMGLLAAGISPVSGALSKVTGGFSSLFDLMGKKAGKQALEETAKGMTTVATNATSLSSIIGKGASGLVGGLGAFASNLGLLVGGGALVAGVGLGIAGLITGFKNLKQAQEEAMLKKDEMTLRAEEADQALYNSFHETYEGMQQDAQNFYNNTVPLISEVFASLKEGGEGDLSALETAVKTHSEEIKNSVYTTTSELMTDLTTFNDNIYNMTIFTSEQIQALMEKRNGDYVNGVDEATTKYLEILNKKSLIGQEIVNENGQTIIYTEEMWQQECQQGLEEYNKAMLDLQAGFSDDRLQLQESFLQETDIKNQAQYDKAIKDLDDNYEEQLGIIDDRYQERLATINSFSDEELAIMGTSRDEQIKIAQGLRDSEIAEATIMKQDTLEQYVQMARDSGIMSDEIADEFLENIERMRAENYGKIANIQDDINSLQGKTVDVTVVFNTEGYDSLVRKMNHVSTGSGKYGYDPALNDSVVIPRQWGTGLEDVSGAYIPTSAYDLYGLKDTKTISLATFGESDISPVATKDTVASGIVGSAVSNYNNAHTTVIHNMPSNNAPMLDILGGIYELLARMNPELNIYTSNPSDEEIVKAVNRYMHIHGKKRW